MEFDSDVWKACSPKIHGKDVDLKPRRRMTSSVEEVVQAGMTKMEILDLLGPPDYRRPPREFEGALLSERWKYKIGGQSFPLTIATYVTVYFDGRSRVSRTAIMEDD